MENEKNVVEELKKQNQLLKDIFIFLLSTKEYSDSQIRAIFGRVDNNRIGRIKAGLKKK